MFECKLYNGKQETTGTYWVQSVDLVEGSFMLLVSVLEDRWKISQDHNISHLKISNNKTKPLHLLI